MRLKNRYKYVYPLIFNSLSLGVTNIINQDILNQIQMIHQKFFGDKAEKVTPENLGEAVQQAIEIEISTIPTYLFTYYSINRSPNQQAMINSLTNALLKIDKEPR